jgi:anaerobic selenocysteine-containing dehydrogenase
VRARDEEAQPTTQESMFSYVRMSDGGPPRFDGPRSEVEVIAALARRVLGGQGESRGGPFDFDALERHASLREAIAAAVPDLAQLAGIETTKREFEVPNRIHRTPTFPTPSGKARFRATPLPTTPSIDATRGELRLITLRSEGQFNTVVYDDDDFYRGQERRDVILMNRADMTALGLRDDDRVRVESEVGAMEGILVRGFDIRAGNAAMYYPEANVLVPARADPRSRTPGFKSVKVAVKASRQLPVVQR